MRPTLSARRGFYAFPAGPQWRRGLTPLRPSELAFNKPLCAALDGFTLHAATRAGALDSGGREKLLRYVLRPPLAQERVESLQGGVVRIVLKRAVGTSAQKGHGQDTERREHEGGIDGSSHEPTDLTARIRTGRLPSTHAG